MIRLSELSSLNLAYTLSERRSMSPITRRGFALATLIALSAIPAFPQGRRYDRARDFVSRVQKNLRRAERFTPPNEKEKERYHNAQQHLSEFDRKLSEGQFDKDKLDEAIDDVKNVVEHNTLSSENRDVLTRDLQELRDLRRSRGESY
jgi:uncharacterized membrane protein YccC